MDFSAGCKLGVIHIPKNGSHFRKCERGRQHVTESVLPGKRPRQKALKRRRCSSCCAAPAGLSSLVVVNSFLLIFSCWLKLPVLLRFPLGLAVPRAYSSRSAQRKLLLRLGFARLHPLKVKVSKIL